MPNGTCKCDPGFEGEHCEIIVDSCLTKVPDCGEHGACVDGLCECQEDYTGSYCEQYIPEEIIGSFTVVEHSHQPDDLRHLNDPGFRTIEVTKEEVSGFFDHHIPYYIQGSSEYIHRVQFSGNDRLHIKEGF